MRKLLTESLCWHVAVLLITKIVIASEAKQFRVTIANVGTHDSVLPPRQEGGGNEDGFCDDVVLTASCGVCN